MASPVKLLRKIIKNDDLRYNTKTILDYYKIGKGTYYTYHQKLKFYSQKGGMKKLIKMQDNKEYGFHIDGVSVSDANKNEFEVNFMTLDETYDGCASLIYVSNEKKIIIDSVMNSSECIKCYDDKHKFKVGDVLTQIIIKYSKKKFPNATLFELSDRSMYNCFGNSLQLKMFRTMTQGQPYYCKFGFRPADKDNYDIYKYNKNLFNTNPTITQKEFNAICNDEYIKKFIRKF